MPTPRLIRPQLGREHGAILDLLSPPMVGRRRMHLPARFSALTLQVRSPSRFLRLLGSTDFGATPASPRSLPGKSAVFAAGTLGFEWDQSPNNGFQPQALMRLSSATVSVPSLLQDYGSTYGPGQATHSLSLYRHSSGALVFGAGTVQWSWGLDSVHDGGSAAADPRLQQAMVNLLADMGSQPATLQAGLTAATASNDFTAPSSTIQTPASGAMLQVGNQVLITGTAGVLPSNPAWGVEVSTDGNTWQPAVGPAAGQTSWSFAWTPAVPGSVTIKSRAFDDSGNLGTPGPGVTVSVAASQQPTIWPSSAVPAIVDQGPDNPVALGVKFYSEVGGTIKGIRFYKSAANTGTHVGNLWSSTGTLLATTTFTSETASGWQQVNFTTPVPINSSTIYVASYHAITWPLQRQFQLLFQLTGTIRRCTRPPSGGSWGGNGVYAYGATSTFPNQTFNATQLLGGRRVAGRAPADTDLDFGDAGRSQLSSGSNAAVHGDGQLLGRQHAKHYKPGNLDVIEHGGGDHQCRASYGSIRGQHDHHRAAVRGDWKHDAHRERAPLWRSRQVHFRMAL